MQIVVGVISALAFGAALNPAGVWWQHSASTLLLLPPTIWALGRAVSATADRSERALWRDLAIAFALWWLILFAKTLGGPFVEADLLQLLGDLAYPSLYLFLVLASDRQPHRRHPVPPRVARLRLAAHGTLVLGATIYFVVLPSASGIGAETSVPAWPVNSYLFYWVLDLYVLGRFLFLTVDAQTQRWRLLYASLSTSLAFMTLSDVVDYGLSRFAQSAWLSTFGQIASMGALALAVAVTAALARFPLASAPRVDLRHDPLRRRARPAGTLLWALTFPVVDATLQLWGLATPQLAAERETVVASSLALLGGLALAQQTLLERRRREAEEERRRTQDSLREAPHDVRLQVERATTEDALRWEEEKLARIFDLSPDGLALVHLEDGVIEEANPRFAQLYGLEPNDLIGRSMDELDLWIEPDDAELLRQAMSRRSRIAGIQRFARDDPQHTRALDFSFERIRFGDSVSILFLVRPVPQQVAERERRVHILRAFEETPWAIVGLDRGDTILSRNAAARELTDAELLNPSRSDRSTLDLSIRPDPADAPVPSLVAGAAPAADLGRHAAEILRLRVLRTPDSAGRPPTGQSSTEKPLRSGTLRPHTLSAEARRDA
ncbi:MAG: PAS domain-containing protein [Acidobacteriota bacterium]